MEVLRSILKDRRIETYEAGGSLSPAQQVFCQKICSRIIQSQFCIVLLNEDTVGQIQRPNANVNMEYGLMLGFNKYIIPFQHDQEQLPFNVAALDTVKYNSSTFRAKAEEAIVLAISQTAQKESQPKAVDPDIGAYLLLHGWIISPIETAGDRAVYQLGAICGFNLCNDFAGNRYMFFGNFSRLSPSAIAWRIAKLAEIVRQRINGLDFRVDIGVISETQRELFRILCEQLTIWILVSNEDDRNEVLRLADGCPIMLNIFTVADVSTDVAESKMH